MYNQESANYSQSCVKGVADKQLTESERLTKRFDELNSVQYNTINEIENKINQILNREEPKSQMKTEDENMILPDFFCRVKREINFMEGQTDRLTKILSHLNEII